MEKNDKMTGSILYILIYYIYYIYLYIIYKYIYIIQFNNFSQFLVLYYM